MKYVLLKEKDQFNGRKKETKDRSKTEDCCVHVTDIDVFTACALKTISSFIDFGNTLELDLLFWCISPVE